ncbi:MAG: ABC transporter substrate-binding protein [Symbiobacteriaceae bacterium]|nr:ABC transporter substrate-binding protein [Symbiobacteriaceae bacterium]
MQKALALLLSLVLLTTSVLPVLAANTNATPTASTVLVNGALVAFDAYNIGGNNYFKLRDLAFVLSGSVKQFGVDFDAATNSIMLVVGESYTPVGNEMTAPGETAKVAVPTASQVILAESQETDASVVIISLLDLVAYNIDGYNYFGLRSVGEALNFAVEWNEAANAISLDTSRGYGEDATLVTESPTSPDTSPREMMTVIDMLGREVEVYKDTQSVAFAWGGAGSLVFAVSGHDLISAGNLAAFGNFLRYVHPPIADIGFVGRGSVDLEAIATQKPDLYIARGTELEGIEGVTKLGIPAIALFAENEEDVIQAITLLGVALNREEQATAALAEFHAVLDRARALVADIPAEERVSAILMGSSPGRIAHGEQMQSKMIENAGGISIVAAHPELTSAAAWVDAGIEQIFAWDPDVIFLTTTASYVEELLQDPAWANLKAMQNGKVLLVPSQMDSWEFPGITTCLGVLWMVHTMYPDKLSREEFDAAVVDFYRAIFRTDVNPDLLGY